MTKKNGDPVRPGINIAPVNSVISSLFERTEVKLNNCTVNPQCETVYSSYLSKLLKFGPVPKLSWMTSEGWYEDANQCFDHTKMNADNDGFWERRNKFREKPNAQGITTKYHTEMVTFSGTFNHDLQSMDSGIPPGVEIKIKFTMTSPQFRLICKEAGEHDAVLELGEVSLHVPIGNMNSKLYDSLLTKLQKNEMRIYYTRTICQSSQIGRGTKFWSSNTLFKTSDILPCRVYFFFLTNDQISPNDFSTNPYWFKRIWDGCFIQSVNLILNGTVMDSLKGNATERDDCISYTRFNIYSAVQNTPEGNGISYEKWMDNCGLFCFDLSSSGRCRNAFFLPSILNGQVRVEVQFNIDTPVPLNLFSYMELPSLMTINKDYVVSQSYFSGNPR